MMLLVDDYGSGRDRGRVVSKENITIVRYVFVIWFPDYH